MSTTVKTTTTSKRRQAGEGVSVIATALSQNGKLGAVSSTTASLQSCGACPLRDNGCYAQNGPLSWIVRRMDKHVTENDVTVEQIARDEAAAIDGLWSGLPLRIHVAGDSRTDETAQIVSAAAERYSKRNRQGSWTYTHAWRAVSRGSWGKVSVLASCETEQDVLDAQERGYAAALVVGEYENGSKAWTLANGMKAIPCPQTTNAAASCATCRLCMDDGKLKARNAVIAFEVHGSQQSKARVTLNVLNS